MGFQCAHRPCYRGKETQRYTPAEENENATHLIDVAIPEDYRVKEKEQEKIEMYQDLAQ